MTVMWSRIHAGLGLLPRELTHDIVVSAIAHRVREADDLDWKRALPPSDEKQRKEFAKDVAAMANTRGGLIVFGVTEENEEATGFLSVANGERERQQLRAIVARWVRPLVSGITMEPLDDADGERSLLVVSVPSSPDAPHVWGEQNQMGVPFREGSDTLWMSEYQLERAYRDRFTRRASDAAALKALVDQVQMQVDHTDIAKGWLIIAARPTAPAGVRIANSSQHEVGRVLREALVLAGQIQPRSGNDLAVLRSLPADAVNSPTTGLRRWVVRDNPSKPDRMTELIQAELHHDGSSVLAAKVTWAWNTERETRIGTKTTVPVQLVETAVVDAIAMATAHARHVGSSGVLQVRAELRAPRSSRTAEIAIGANASTHDKVDLVPGSRIISQMVPVDAEVRADADADALRQAVRQLAEDMLHQFGVQGLMTIPVS